MASNFNFVNREEDDDEEIVPKKGISNIVFLVSRRYADMDVGDQRIDEMLEKINKLVKKPNRRAGNTEKRVQIEKKTNQLILDHVDNINLIIANQNNLLKQGSKDIKGSMITFLDEVAVKSRRSESSIEEKIDDLAKLMDGKDKVILDKYDDIDHFVENIEKVRLDAIKAAEEFETETAIANDELEGNDEGDMKIDSDEMKFMCAKETEEFENRLQAQMVRITKLRSDIESKDREFSKVKKNDKELRQRCHDCHLVKTCMNPFRNKNKCKFL